MAKNDEEKAPVQVSVTASGNHEDREAVHQVAAALSEALNQPPVRDLTTATVVIKIKKEL